MVIHRAADSRLLTNLLLHEKEYTKQLIALLDSSNASLTSFAAYAAASPQPASQVVMSIAGSLAAADEALRRYAQSVELWRETMVHLKDMEDELGNMFRDKEILVTRLLKASKSSKSGSASIRGSLLQSSSSLSSRDGSASRPLSLTFSTSSKLGAAQTELQACELHLAAKESELEVRRSAVLREGLGARLKAMVDCGWAWGEVGREGLRTLEMLGRENNSDHHLATVNSVTGSECDSFIIKRSSASEFSSVGPSQSASQINHPDPTLTLAPSIPTTSVLEGTPVYPPPPPPRAAGMKRKSLSAQLQRASIATTITESGTLSGSCASTPSHAAFFSATPSTLTYAPAVAVHLPPSTSASACPSPPLPSGLNDNSQNTDIHLDIPAPHALGTGYLHIPIAIPAWVASPSPPELKSGIEEVDDKDVMMKEDTDVHSDVHSDVKRGRPALRSRSRSKVLSEDEAMMASRRVAIDESVRGGGTRERKEDAHVDEEIGLYAHHESEREGVESENEVVVSKQAEDDHGRAYTVQVVEKLSDSGELDDNSEEEGWATRIKLQAKGKERERDQSREMDGPLEEREIEDGDSTERAPFDMDEPFAVENPRYMQTGEVEKEGHREMNQGIVGAEKRDAEKGEKLRDAEEEEEERKSIDFLSSQSARQKKGSQTKLSVSVTVHRGIETEDRPPSLTSSSAHAPVSKSLGSGEPAPGSHLSKSGSVSGQGYLRDTANPNVKPKTDFSPSKRFLGSLRGWFGASAGSKHEKEKSLAKLRSGAAAGGGDGDPDPQPETDAEASDSSGSSDEKEDKVGGRKIKKWKKKKKRLKPKEGVTGHGGLQGLLFRSPDKDKEKSWETRTAKNLRELGRENERETVGSKEVWGGGANMGIAVGAVARAGIVETSPSRRGETRSPVSSSRPGSVDRLVGWIGGAGSEKGRQRERSASDVGTGIGLWAAVNPGQEVQKWGSKLRKNRVPDQRSTRVVTGVPSGPGPGPVPKRPPVAGSAAMAAARWVHRPSYPQPQLPSNSGSSHLTSSESKHRSKPQRSASVDIGVGIAKRRSGGEWEEGQDRRKERDNMSPGGTSVSPGGKTMIVDLGWKGDGEDEGNSDGDNRGAANTRRGRGGVGGDVIRHMALQTKSPYVPKSIIGVSSTPKKLSKSAVAHDEYASDTAVAGGMPVGRRKSLTRVKMKERLDVENDVVSGVSRATSQKSQSTSAARRSGTTPPAKRATTEAATTSTTDVENARKPRVDRYQRKLSFGGGRNDNVGGSGNGELSRNSSLLSTASAPLHLGKAGVGVGTDGDGEGSFRGGTASGTGKARRLDTLGQGMKGGIGAGGGSGRDVARKSSVRSNTAVAHPGVTVGGSKPPATPSKSGTGLAPTTVVQPMPAAQSLMSIVENVARVNREGWNVDRNVTTSKASFLDSQTGSMKVMEMVKAPPRVGREVLEVMNLKEMKSHLGKSVGDVPGLFQVQAPGSVFDERYRLRGASASVLELNNSASGAHDRRRMVSTHNSKVQTEQQQSQGAVRPVRDEMGQRASSGRRSASVSATTRVGRPTGSAAGVVLAPVPVGLGHVQDLKLSPSLQVRIPLKSALKNSSRTPSPAPAPVPSSRIVQNFEVGRHMPLTASPLRPPPTEVAPLRELRLKRPELCGEPVDGDKKDSAGDSTSSSETGEVFYSGEEEVEWFVPSPPPAVLASIPVPVQQTRILSVGNHPLENGIAAGYTSEQSESTASVLMTTGPGHPPQQQPIPQTPRKRKSVRVSLQPTFSPSPPAIEYDDEEETKNQSRNHHRDRSPERQQNQPPLIVTTPVQKTGADIWEDSSEEDDEYKMAKMALTRAAKKDKEVSLLVANRRAS